jgi:gliding motility-associated-like protein
MVRPFLFLLGILISQLSPAQNRQAQVWKYGENFGSTLDFGFSPIKRYKANIGFNFGVASICDSNGIFLFSGSSGILNRKDSMMPSGQLQSRFGYALFGSYLIIPYFDKKNIFHYFTVSNAQNASFNSLPPYFIYDITVDMRLDGGLGDVDTTKTQIIDSLVDLQLSCMLHANGRDSWLIGRGYQNDSLFAYQITDSGAIKKVITDINSPVKKPNLGYGSVVGGSQWDSQMKSSPDSKLLLIPRRMKEYAFSELLQFDRETGQFSNKIEIKDTTGNFNITNYGDGCFSADSRQLYYSIGTKTQANWQGEGPGHFWQFDLSNYDSAAIAQSKIFLGRLERRVPNVPELRPWAPKMQLAMDGKIYVSPGIRTDKYMSTIRCPDKRGVDCGLEFRTIDLGDGKNGAYFPVLNQTFVRNAGIFQLQANKRNLCQSDTLELSGYGAGAEKFRWTVSPALPQNVKVDTLTWQKIDTRNIPPGAYTFSCQSSSRCGDNFEKSITIQINPNPSPSQPPRKGGVSMPCLGDSVFFFVPNPVSGYRYFWSTGQVNSQIVVKQTGKYSLDSVVNAFGCGIKVKDTVSVVIKDFAKPPSPILSSPLDRSICEGQNFTLKVLTQNLNVVWNTGQEGDSISVTGNQELGVRKKFWAFGQTSEGCVSSASDTMFLTWLANPRPRFVDIDSILSKEKVFNQNYCVQGQTGSRFSFSVTGGEKVDSSENCITVNWNKLSTVNYQLSTKETLQSLPCSGSVSQNFIYSPSLQIPNLVTPNGDGRNDAFEIEDLEFYAPHSLQIFDRWGKKLLETSAYKNDWNTEPGIYFFSLVVDGKQFTGWVMVGE